MTRRHAAALLPLLGALACSSTNGSGTTFGGGGGGSGASSSVGGGQVFGAFGTAGSGACVVQAPKTFANAVCVCGDLSEAGMLKTHAPSKGAASVGVNGQTGAGTGAWVEGTLTSYDGLGVGGELTVRDSVVSTKNVSGAGVFSVGGDLNVGGQLDFAGSLIVDGTLRVAQTSSVLVPQHIGQTGPYTAPSGPPCGCTPGTLLPIVPAVAKAAITNDDAAHGLTSDGASLLGKGTLTLTTGTYYFKDVARIGLSSIVIDGAVSLAFDGGLVGVGVGQITLQPGASLDMYVNGLLGTAGGVTLGDPEKPSRSVSPLRERGGLDGGHGGRAGLERAGLCSAGRRPVCRSHYRQWLNLRQHAVVGR